MISARIAVAVVLALCAAAPVAAQRLYKYVDANGKTIYTDKPPIDAAGRAAEQLNAQGTVVRRVQAAPTAEERAAAEEARKRKIEESVRDKDEQRKNEALLSTYASESDIDRARARDLKDIDEAIKQTQRRLADAQQRQLQLKSESDSYQSKPVPPQLRRDLEALDVELQAYNNLLEVKRRESDLINARYDADKKRYLALTKSGAVAARR